MSALNFAIPRHSNLRIIEICPSGGVNAMGDDGALWACMQSGNGAAPGVPAHVLAYMHALEIAQRYSDVLAQAAGLLRSTRCGSVPSIPASTTIPRTSSPCSC